MPTIIDKIWRSHLVVEPATAPATLYIDLHLVHEVTSPQAFDGLRQRGLRVRRPDRTVGTTDHSIPTTPVGRPGPTAIGRLGEAALPSGAVSTPLGASQAALPLVSASTQIGPRGEPTLLPIEDETAARQVAQFEANCREFDITCYGRGDERNGIVHVIGPELGLTQPGMTIVCGDSHTATHGAFGALAFGIGTSEVEMVLATQCLLQRRPATMRVTVSGRLQSGVTAKDVILAIIARIGVAGGTGHVIEYDGAAVRSLGMEGRMTLCNMSIEGGARAGLVAPDEVTVEYLAGRPEAPGGAAWDDAVSKWRTLRTDPDATFDREVSLTGDEIRPMITFGTNPGMAIPIDAPVPCPGATQDAAALSRALDYMRLEPGKPLLGHPIDVVFVGSCTNGRLSDLREAAAVLRGRTVNAGVRMLVVPGSHLVKRLAEAENLHRVFTEAGAEWREPGCSMCIAMNGDQIQPGQLAVSTSNRNFEGRQGPGGRTLLASPATAAASAVAGCVADPRRLP